MIFFSWRCRDSIALSLNGVPYAPLHVARVLQGVHVILHHVQDGLATATLLAAAPLCFVVAVAVFAKPRCGVE